MDDKADGTFDPARRLERIRESASNWHRVQLAMFGFAGLCGVLQQIGESSAPRSVQVVAGVLVLVSLAVALLATYLVGRVAWPLYRARATAADPTEPVDLAGPTRSLRSGLVATFAAIVILALAATSGWWPSGGAGDAGQLVRVDTTNGSVCGRLVEGGGISVEAQGQVVRIPQGTVTGLTPVSSCP
jgi:hypothetical protein